jgi:hypothetical protein
MNKLALFISILLFSTNISSANVLSSGGNQQNIKKILGKYNLKTIKK